jgi:phosphatidylcholine synthase
MLWLRRTKPLATPGIETVPLNTTGSAIHRALVWGVHVFTASGAVTGFMTLLSIAAENLRAALLWMALSVVIDTLDGALARRVHASQVLPQYDGRMLDWVIDWVNYVFLPAYFFYSAGLVAPQFRMPCVIGILLSSGYHFGNRNGVTEQGHFRGFPAFWNMIVFYLFILHLGPVWNLALTGVVCILHFCPIHFVYPTRMRRLRGVVWSGALVALSTGLCIVLQYPAVNMWLLASTLVSICLLGAAGLWLTYQDGRVRV